MTTRRELLRSALGVGAATLLGLRAGGEARGDGADGPRLPAGMKGFAGVLDGRVTEVQRDGRGFRLKVAKIGERWRSDRSTDPTSAVGETLLVNAQWEQGPGGGWRPVEAHVRFIRSLAVDEDLAIEVVNDEGERLHILELTKAQRERSPR